jgi:GINS complex subunit 4
MVDTPDLDQAVFIRALDDVGDIIVPGTDVRCDVRRGDIWVLRWSAVKEIVERGDAELI